MAAKSPPPAFHASPFADMRAHHVAFRTPEFARARRWYVETLDFRVIAEWTFGDLQLAFLAPPGDDGFCIELLGGGNPAPAETRPWSDLGDSLSYRGYHHVCFDVKNVEATVAKLRERGATITLEPVVVDSIRRKIAFFADPFGNLIELAEVLE